MRPNEDITVPAGEYFMTRAEFSDEMRKLEVKWERTFRSMQWQNLVFMLTWGVAIVVAIKYLP